MEIYYENVVQLWVEVHNLNLAWMRSLIKNCGESVWGEDVDVSALSFRYICL